MKVATYMACISELDAPYNGACARNSLPETFVFLARRSKVLTIHGTEDETIPVADAREFDQVLLNNELIVVEGGTHRFATEPEQSKVLEALARYI